MKRNVPSQPSCERDAFPAPKRGTECNKTPDAGLALFICMRMTARTLEFVRDGAMGKASIYDRTLSDPGSTSPDRIRDDSKR